MKIIFATKNIGKLEEMRKILSGFQVVSAFEAGIEEDVVEDKETFVENALKKARFIHEKVGGIVIADDSGLCIKALDGAPGVYSARWAGENSSDQDKIKKTLSELVNIPKEERQAYFESAAVLILEDGSEHIFDDKVFGSISFEPHGIPLPKLPYDSIFIPSGYDKTFAEMSPEDKNSMSHRGLAFKKLKEFLISIR